MILKFNITYALGRVEIYYTALKRLQSRVLNKYGDFNCVDIV